MKRANITAFGQTFKNSILIETPAELRDFFKYKKKNPGRFPVVSEYKTNLIHHVVDGKKIVIHAGNEISYFTLSDGSDFEIELIKQ